MSFTTQTAREAGRKGGLAVVNKHGRDHMRRIGRRGFHATVQKVYGGDYRKAINTLINRGLLAGDPIPQNHAWTPADDRMVDWLPTAWTPPTPKEDRPWLQS